MFRVSRVLSASGLVDPQWFTEASRERGRAVHAIAEAVFQDHIVHVAPAYEGYKTALMNGIAALRFSPVCIERRLFDRDLSGRPDAVGFISHNTGDQIQAGPAIVDIKSGARMPSHGLQLAFYEQLADANKLRDLLPSWFRDQPWERIGLYVRDTGTYKIHRYADYADQYVAQALIDVIRWRHAHGLIEPDDVSDYEDPAFHMEV
jgi:hypothetical protein